MAEHTHAHEGAVDRAARSKPSVAGRGAGPSLQRSAGNRAVAAFIAEAQAKLEVGAAADPLEYEADAIAADVVRSIRTGSLAATDAAPTPPRIQREASGAVGAGGGRLDAPTEQAITGSTGAPLPLPVRRTMERAFGGADFRDVRVHTGPGAAELNDRLGARAFTVGSDIYFRDRLPGATDPVLAHELVHVIQQGRATPGSGRETAKRTVQRDLGLKSRAARGGASTTKAPKPRSKDVGRLLEGVSAYGYELDKTTGLVDTTVSGTKFPMGPDLTVTAAPARRGNTQYAGEKFAQIATPGHLAGKWVSVGYLDEQVGLDESSTLAEGIEWGGAASDAYGSLGETGGVLGYRGDMDRLHDRNAGTRIHDPGYTATDTSGLTYSSEAMSVAGNVGDVAGMVLAIASVIQTVRDAEKTKLDVAEEAGKLAGSTVAVAAGLAGTVKEFDKTLGGISTTTDVLGSISAGFEGIMALVKVTRKLIEAGKQHHESTLHEKLQTSGEVLRGLLEATQAAVSGAKIFIDTFDTATGAAIANAVPGLGIAIAAVDLAVRAVDVVTGSVHLHRMRTDKRASKERLGGKVGTKFKQEAQKILDDFENKALNGVHVTDDAELERYQDAREYLMAKGIQYINQKRIQRAFLKMSVSGMKIAADAATLSGVASGAGIGLKVGAVAVDVGSGLFRRLKQMGHDYRAKKVAADPNYRPNGVIELFSKMGFFNAKKSTAAKLDGYNRTVDQVFDMMVRARGAPDPDRAAKKVARYVEAIGLSVAKLYKLRSTPAKLRKEMVDAMKNRE
ncbi:DUF4157 domain-containing protein [Nitriliruptor alkaliphilus]|uniref:eCIS core domain-containing protein n=1 Tax=Nitriliruptor alkaliphilus TaxID=427918 RepID=UPI000695FD8E|nr:DUF4157 domain-containing protein [Nitriliruptor alkaliphilus]